MNRIIRFIASVLFCSVVPAAAFGGTDVIKVMTRNEYLGADLTPVILAQTPQEFVAAATAALTQIAANDFPRRAEGLAREVFLTRPDVIGLQEVFNFTVNSFNAGPPFVDHLQVTLNKLSALGLHYVVAATVEHLDFTLPLDVNGDGIADFVRVLDRDVILVRRGVSYMPLQGNVLNGGLCGVSIPNPAPISPLPASLQSAVSQDGCSYTVVGMVNSPVGSITVKRGFVGVDVRLSGKTFRVVNTHLEVVQPDPTNPNSTIIQFLQSVELAGTLQATTPANRTLILLGDFNSSPSHTPIGPIVPPYRVLAGTGFADIWKANPLAQLDPDGFTCCNLSDLSNAKSLLTERIDLIFVREPGHFLPLAVVTGRLPLFPLFRPPFWASDHGGVFGTLVFGN
jgi:hypothetical protein